MTPSRSVYLHALGIVCAAGRGKRQVAERLFAGDRSGMVIRNDLLLDGALTVGAVTGDLPDLASELGAYASRNARMLTVALEEIRADIEAAVTEVGPRRVAVVIGSSTSGIGEGEVAVAHLHATGALPDGYDIRRQEMGSVAEIVARQFGLLGPAYTISTACSSGAQATAAGRRLLLTGLADMVIAGGADTLCRLTVNGFHALSALSRTVCNPFSRNRDGTSIGEGAAVFVMRREFGGVELMGMGSTSDAFSMTAPEPEGRGIAAAMRKALEDAGVDAQDVDYVHLHGTATQQNDAAESKAVQRVFARGVPCSSSKPQLGHTLGAAGALGVAVCWLTFSAFNTCRLLPPHLWDGQPEDGLLGGTLVRTGQELRAQGRAIALANACAFGGNNVSLVFGRV